MRINVEANKQEYIRRYQEILGHREEAMDLLKFIKNPKKDFFTAPASADRYLSVEGGLCQYALLLHDAMLDQLKSPLFSKLLTLADKTGKRYITEESVAIASLLSGLDNIMMFTTETKNRKSYDKAVIEEAVKNHETVRSDSKGQFVWEQYNGYSYDDVMPLGNGVRAISFIQAFMQLNKYELMAIRWANASSQNSSDYASKSNALEQNPLLVLLSNAHNTVKHLLGNELFFENFYGNPLPYADEFPHSFNSEHSFSEQQERRVEEMAMPNMAPEPNFMDDFDKAMFGD